MPLRYLTLTTGIAYYMQRFALHQFFTNLIVCDSLQIIFISKVGCTNHVYHETSSNPVDALITMENDQGT